MPVQVGSYQIRVNNTATPFWPLEPGATVTDEDAPTVLAAPNQQNTLVCPPSFGIFDIVIQLSEDDIVETEVAELDPPLADRHVTAVATTTEMPVLLDGGARPRMCHICFAVPVCGDAFEGTLRLTAQSTSGGTANRRLDVLLRVGPSERVSNLFIFFIVHPRPEQAYCWHRIQVVDQSDGTTSIAGAQVMVKVLRDNYDNGYRTINRRIALTTRRDGYAARDGREVIALPVNWPLLYNATSAGYEPRGHMLRLVPQHRRHNQDPRTPPAIRMTRSAAACLTGRRILLDPGHGVVYAYDEHRRSQEWFVAHRIAERVEALLTGHYGMSREDVLWTRTAGLGLIDPDRMTNAQAPDEGGRRYELDLQNRRARIDDNALGLRQLSDLLLTRHNDQNQSQPVAAEDRQRLLDINQETVLAIVGRINQQLQKRNRAVGAGSVRWDAALVDYVYTVVAAEPPHDVLEQAVHFPIGIGDWFDVDDDMIDVLAERTARWSIAMEIGGGPPSAPFPQAARQAMLGAGALEYMRQRIIDSIAPGVPDAFLTSGVMGWHPTTRLQYMNGITPPCDLYISIHMNAANAKGGQVLVRDPPQQQVRIGKVFLKYLDPFDQGFRQGGIANNIAGMLGTGNQRRDRYVYFEVEFMDALNPDDPTQYRYAQMVQEDFIDRVARQITSGIVELLVDVQPNADMDTVTYRGEFTLW